MLAYLIEQQGHSLKLSCSDNRELVTNQYDDALAFLLEPCGEFAVTYNLDAFVDSLVSIMPKALAAKVKEGGRVFTPENRKLYYQTGRVFGINHIDFYGLNRYSEEPLTNCQKVLELAEKVVEAYHEIGIKDVTRLTSPVALYSQVLDSIPYPRACDLPESAFPMLEACTPIMSREWRQVYQLGRWNAYQISDYDLTAAYPAQMAQLPDISKAHFFSSKTMPDKYSWGVLTGQLKITKPVSPFICKEKGVYGIGEWPDTITTEQLRFLRASSVGDFTMESGEFFLLPKSYGYPFKPTMESLYNSRESDNPLVSKIAKGIAVGIGGKLAEIYEDRLGDNFNSIYALMTTSRCMLTVGSFIYNHHIEDDVVSVLVDGFMATGIRLPVVNRKVMGTWKINEPLPALVASLEYQWQGNKRPNYKTYDEMIAAIREHPDRSYFEGVDLNLLSHNRNFTKLPRTGKELLENKYRSEPYEV